MNYLQQLKVFWGTKKESWVLIIIIMGTVEADSFTAAYHQGQSRCSGISFGELSRHPSVIQCLFFWPNSVFSISTTSTHFPLSVSLPMARERERERNRALTLTRLLVKKGGRGRRREVENGVAVIGRFLKRGERKDRIRFPF